MQRKIVRIISLINKAEDWLLIFMLSLMIVLAVTQIVYRNVLGGGIGWIDPMLRMLVMWVALAGAMIATRNNNHIRIDIFVRNLSESRYRLVQRIVYLYSAAICGVIAFHSVRLVRMDYEFSTQAFADIPAWFTELIIPISFSMMAIRYLMLFVAPPQQER